MSGEVIDQEGNALVWKAHYWRHHRECWEECASIEEAVAFLRNGEEYGELSSRGVVFPDGTEREYDWVHETLGGVPLESPTPDPAG